jgi:hypothetical protein
LNLIDLKFEKLLKYQRLLLKYLRYRLNLISLKSVINQKYHLFQKYPLYLKHPKFYLNQWYLHYRLYH